jgi:hypothetical protein
MLTNLLFLQSWILYLPSGLKKGTFSFVVVNSSILISQICKDSQVRIPEQDTQDRICIGQLEHDNKECWDRKAWEHDSWDRTVGIVQAGEKTEDRMTRT